MPKNKKRTAADYEREIEETAKRMRKKPEYRHSAKNTPAWYDFLDSVGINIYDASSQRQDFFEQVRQAIPERAIIRKSAYAELRQAGIPAREARRMRDWSLERREFVIGQWKNKA